MEHPIRRARPEKTGIGAPLGGLEMAVMQQIWACPHDGCLAADVQQALERTRPIALTTVLTTVDRLNKKGILQRVREGKAYRYHAALTEEQLQQRIVEGILSNLIAHFPQAVASYFAKHHAPLSAEDEETLADLARQVEEMQSAPFGDDGAMLLTDDPARTPDDH